MLWNKWDPCHQSIAESPWGTSLSQPCPNPWAIPTQSPCPCYPCIHALAISIPVPLVSLFPSLSPLSWPCHHCPQPHPCAIPSLFNATLFPCCRHPCVIPTPVRFWTTHLGCPLNCDIVLSLSPCLLFLSPCPCQLHPFPCYPCPHGDPMSSLLHPCVIPIPIFIYIPSCSCPHATHCPHCCPPIPTPIPVPTVSLTPSLCPLPCPQVSPSVHRCRTPGPLHPHPYAIPTLTLVPVAPASSPFPQVSRHPCCVPTCAQTQDPGCPQMWPPPGLDQQLEGVAWGQPCH